MDRPILLKFGGLVHYWSLEPASSLKLGTTGGAGNLKWQCSTNCFLSSLYRFKKISEIALFMVSRVNRYLCVKEYSSEYSDSAFKVEDTIVSRR